jgi:hypothetical protein
MLRNEKAQFEFMNIMLNDYKMDIRCADSGVKNKSEIKAPPRIIGVCKVCGDEASGMYFGALVCVPCKVRLIYFSLFSC